MLSFDKYLHLKNQVLPTLHELRLISQNVVFSSLAIKFIDQLKKLAFVSISWGLCVVRKGKVQ
jgi:hypothetical protein